MQMMPIVSVGPALRFAAKEQIPYDPAQHGGMLLRQETGPITVIRLTESDAQSREAGQFFLQDDGAGGRNLIVIENPINGGPPAYLRFTMESVGTYTQSMFAPSVRLVNLRPQDYEPLAALLPETSTALKQKLADAVKAIHDQKKKEWLEYQTNARNAFEEMRKKLNAVIPESPIGQVLYGNEPQTNAGQTADKFIEDFKTHWKRFKATAKLAAYRGESLLSKPSE